MTFYESFVDEMDKLAASKKDPGMIKRLAKGAIKLPGKTLRFVKAHPYLTAGGVGLVGYGYGKRKGKREGASIPVGAVGGHGL